MPQVVDHMRTWAAENPDAVRLFFGTVITHEMIEGASAGGVRRAGLKGLRENGMLTAAYNISKIAAKEPKATAGFLELIIAIEARLAA